MISKISWPSTTLIFSCSVNFMSTLFSHKAPMQLFYWPWSLFGANTASQRIGFYINLFISRSVSQMNQILRALY
uniref:Uncharacterized protein n=1 Tax=Candidatus Kentrum sp. TUN TaxID=2126343 RepID=A0A450ZVQ3_9GAMM|nr:MAG: hypothetical protein BECKTUN1418F_GA0071002_104817 [Candidatus Kentron sp. TUN]VFK57833.1 MAG: hypothetical protein BECKTUN1418E_GA0071001_104717 [Candidatus Kentron sp. TUN]